MKHTKESVLCELRALRREAIKVARHLRKYDPEGACALSAACAVQDIEQAIENIDCKGMETPKDLQQWMNEANGM